MKNLDEQIEDDLKQIDQPEEKETVEEIENKPEDQAVSEEEKPDVTIEVKPEIKVEDPKLDPKAMAAMRYELSEAKRQLAEAKQPKEQPKETPKAPDPTEDPLGYLTYELTETKRQLAEITGKVQEDEQTRTRNNMISAAAEEFVQYEERFKASVKDYDDVAQHFEKTFKRALSIANPGISPKQVNEAYTQRVLQMASQAVQSGYDPASYIYNVTKSQYDYKPKEEPKPEVKVPDLRVVDKNKKKSGNGMGGGSSKTALTPEQIEKMSIADMEANREEVDAILGGMAY